MNAGLGMVTRMDLRVHTTAPSSRKDDAKFIAQAKAYGAFALAKTHACHAIHPSEGSLPARDGLHSPSSIGHVSSVTKLDMRHIPQQKPGDTTGVLYDPTTFLEETQLGYTALESQLFIPSSMPKDHRKPPSHMSEGNETAEAHHPANEHPNLDHSTEGESTSSHRVPSQSSYLHSPILDRSIKKPRPSAGNRQFFQPTKSLLPPFVPSKEGAGPAIGSSGRIAKASPVGARNQHYSVISESNSILGDDVTSELPSSYSLSDMTSESSKSKHQSIQRFVSDPGPSPEKPVQSDHESVEPNLSRLSPLLQPAHQSRHTEHSRKPSPTAPRSSHSNSKTVVKDFAGHGTQHVEAQTEEIDPSIYSGLPTSIRPPPPQPSLQPFETHITDALRYLGENKGLTESYKPISVTREPRQSERGFWAINIASWPAQLQGDFFQFLARMIEAGRVGWGIWCTRESDSLDVQVFCWGEVVRHVYLMLYVASKSKVRKLGLKWIDSEGNVVVQMRGASEVDNADKID